MDKCRGDNDTRTEIFDEPVSIVRDEKETREERRTRTGCGGHGSQVNERRG